MKSKPRVGVILLRAEWFDSVVALPQLVSAVRADQQAIEQELSQFFILAGVWPVNSQESLQACVQAVKAVETDLFILSFQVWAEDFYLVPLLDAIGDQPLAVWCFQPWTSLPRPVAFSQVLRGSGPVGTFEGLGTLRNLGAKFAFTLGPQDDPRVRRDLAIAARAGQVRQALRKARFGLLPGRNEQMQSTFVDEFRLRREIGPQVKLLSVSELKRKADSLQNEEVCSYVEQLRAEYPVRGVDEEDLALGARASLALAHLAVDQKLDVLSLDDIDPELHEVFGLRPCLYPPFLDELGVVLGLEGDLGAATALFVMQRLTGGPLFFVEFWFWDELQNVIVGGHAGVQNPQAAVPGQAWISHDYEFAQSDRSEGAHFQFVARSGRVTLLQMRATPGSWQAICVLGEALDDGPWLEGYPHAAIRLDVSVEQFVRRAAKVGTTQHWIMGYGDIDAEIQALCDWLDIPLEIIQ